MELWVYPVDKTNPPTTTWLNFNMRGDRMVWICGGGGVNVGRLGSYFANAGDWKWCTEGSLQARQWNHCAVTYDGKNRIFYLNGEQVGTFACTGDISTNGNAYSIFATCSPGCNVDEVRVWNYARTQKQIKSTMRKSLPSSYSNNFAYGLMLNLTFEEVAGQPQDRSGNTNHALSTVGTLSVAQCPYVKKVKR